MQYIKKKKAKGTSVQVTEEKTERHGSHCLTLYIP